MGMQETPATGAPGFRALFARSADPYAGADIALARRFGVAMWTFGTVFVAVLNVFFPPTRALGEVAGWSIAAVSYVVVFALIAVMADKRREIGFDFLYALGFLGVLLLAVSQHGAGGRVAPYHELFMFQLIGAALMHPPRRVLLFLAFVAAATFAPVVYAPATAEPGEAATELFLWAGLALVMMLLMQTIRSQRLALQKEGDEARQLARVDALTTLGNRRAFDEAMDAELARSRRAGSPLSLIVADLNGFKEINDRYGHVAGDGCLHQAAAALREAVRRPDLCFRWGGDEFAVLLTGADAPIARALALRLEKAVAGTCRRPDGGALTLTCGHAELDPDMSAAEAVARADATLLAMKAREREIPPLTPPLGVTV
jgi:diguanylate cyclase (GGDEF)-like protein